MTADDVAQIRRRMALAGMPVDEVTDDDLKKGVQMMGEAFRDFAPVTAADAATIILDGVRANKWRILVGEDARAVDLAVRADPEHAYDVEFWNALLERGHFGAFGSASPS
jgi:hypothetical protein